MKAEGRPILSAEATLTLNNHEIDLLFKLTSYGLAVVEPIIGKNPTGEASEPWREFLGSLHVEMTKISNRFHDADRVFRGEKRIKE